MNDKAVVLTPAQRDFLADAIDDFAGAGWHVASAGEAGSDRRFFRVCHDGGVSYVLVVWNSEDHDWDRFLRIERDLRRKTGFLPRVFAHDARHGLILEEDLGSLTLCGAVRSNPDTGLIEKYYGQVLDALVQWQSIPPESSSVINNRAMDAEMFLWETDYFAQHCVTGFFGREALLDHGWECERTALARTVADLPQVTIHRDFQSENILLGRDAVRFVDYQGARRGPAGYDLASLLFDPYVPSLDRELVGRLLDYYQSVSPLEQDRCDFYRCAAQRLMQALGAYGNLSLHKGKDWYRVYVPVALERLVMVLDGCPELEHTRDIVGACLESLAETSM